jgi:hypothetical protein
MTVLLVMAIFALGFILIRTGIIGIVVTSVVTMAIYLTATAAATIIGGIAIENITWNDIGNLLIDLPLWLHLVFGGVLFLALVRAYFYISRLFVGWDLREQFSRSAPPDDEPEPGQVEQHPFMGPPREWYKRKI